VRGWGERSGGEVLQEHGALPQALLVFYGVLYGVPRPKSVFVLVNSQDNEEDKAGKKIWRHIGAVWSNKSGNGFTLTGDYLLLGDGLTVMLPFDEDNGEVAPPKV
jgi:hypothetical protein